MSDPRRACPLRAVETPPARAGFHTAEHDRITRERQAKRIARLLNLPYRRAGDGPAYLVPADALPLEEARRCGVEDETGLYGGVVPWAFVATKAVSHGLVRPDSSAPEGWNIDLAERLRPYVLKGWTAFSREEAQAAALELFADGAVRIKDVHATAGQGQTVVRSRDEIIAALSARDASEIARHGLVIEENLVDPRTFSVGATRIGEDRIAYWGVQRFIEAGDVPVYAGSDLHVAQGGYDDLLDFPMPEGARMAIALARAWEAAVFDAYPGLVASRRNYDVILGRNAAGEDRAGVLEQSWRIGGASGAEVAALEAFRRDRTPRLVRSQTMEIRSADAAPPEDAVLYYQGVDPDAGPLTKYARVLP